ncbi:MAG TPA: outer membrane beta-barrel protein, partial [Planctomycetota bacterium]|nr:outer membrane beta-barrel protein [Planctomycetota bacterium]
PFTNTGVRATYNASDTISGTIGFSNGLNGIGTDQYSDADHGKMVELNGTMKPNKDTLISATLLIGTENSISGSTNDKFYLFDIVASYTMDKLTVALNLDFASIQNPFGPQSPAFSAPRGALSGIAVYGKYAWTDAMASALRVEYLSDKNGVFFVPNAGVPSDSGTGARVFEVTLTQEMKVAQQLILRVEIRSDNSNNHVMNRDGKAARGDTTLGFEAIMPF